MSRENIEAMQENVEAAQRAIDAWNSADLDRFLAEWHPECEWRPAFPKGTEGSGAIFRGHEELREAWRGVREAWDVYLLDVEEVRVVGDELVVLGQIRARGAESGVELDSGWSAVVRFRDGMVLTAWDWLDRDSALEAVGLSE